MSELEPTRTYSNPTETDEPPMYYAVCEGSEIDARTTYVYIPDNDDMLAVVCGGEQITTTWKDLFRLLKWACEQWGGAGK